MVWYDGVSVPLTIERRERSPTHDDTCERVYLVSIVVKVEKDGDAAATGPAP
jgi:hypothetical protein